MTQLYTLAEVAAKIHKSPRWLREFLRHNDDCCFKIGRTPEFDDAMVVRLISPASNPARLALPVDARVLMVGLLLILTVILLFGLAPALRASSPQLAPILSGELAVGGTGRSARRQPGDEGH